MPDDAGVIIRTAAEGATEEDLMSDVERLQAQWDAIQAQAEGQRPAPPLLHGEPDLADPGGPRHLQRRLHGSSSRARGLDTIERLRQRRRARSAPTAPSTPATATCSRAARIDEQLAKALDRKVWLPSGGSLVIDRTEAMTVIDVNTGKFTGSGGNLEETVTRNNLEAAEEIVRQLRLRDIGGIIVIDFIDMVLESNRDLVLRRLTECLGRDRTKHQVAEVTSLGLVQMTRKRVGRACSKPSANLRDLQRPGRDRSTWTPVERKNGAANGPAAPHRPLRTIGPPGPAHTEGRQGRAQPPARCRRAGRRGREAAGSCQRGGRDRGGDQPA